MSEEYSNKMYRPGFGSMCSRCGWDVDIDEICAHWKHHSHCCKNAVNWVIIE